MYYHSLLFAVLVCTTFASRDAIWSELPTANQNPIQDYGGHSTVVVGSTIYEFGGIKENRSLSVAESIIGLYANLRKFNTRTSTWSPVVSSNGVEPPVRGWTSMAVLGNSIYLFGGVSYFFAPLGDFWEFKLDTLEWINRTPVNGPASRSGPSLTAYKGKLLLTGGLNAYTLVGYGDLWQYDPQTQQWTQLLTTGVQPTGRALIRTAIYKDYLYVFGGEGFEPSIGYFSYSLEMYRVNLRTFVWELVTPEVGLPRNRLHYSVAVVDDTWHFHGGDYGNCPPLDLLIQTTSVYDFKKNIWYDGYLPTYAEGPVTKRGEFSCIRDKCYHTGGYNGIKCDNSEQQYINKVYVYYPKNFFLDVAKSRV